MCDIERLFCLCKCHFETDVLNLELKNYPKDSTISFLSQTPLRDSKASQNQSVLPASIAKPEPKNMDIGCQLVALSSFLTATKEILGSLYCNGSTNLVALSLVIPFGGHKI